ncbi:hypothetical protein HZB94_01745 [Candidatus Falkowbacteria bacterium]|nr:hypothetical protein [Candidatus Falkowbacteria bacterium]
MHGYSGTTNCSNCGRLFSYSDYDCAPSLCAGCYGARKIASHSHGDNSGTAICTSCGRRFSYDNYDCRPSLCAGCYTEREISKHKV